MDLAKFFLDIGALKKLPRSGWLIAGIQNPESIADHSFRVAFIAWVLAEQEGLDTNKIIKMALLHDLLEARIGDLNLVMKRYLKPDKEKVESDILKNSNIGKEAKEILKELHENKTREAQIVKDADKVELFIQIKEYEATGFKEVNKWKHFAENQVKTENAKKLLEEIEKTELTWWYNYE